MNRMIVQGVKLVGNDVSSMLADQEKQWEFLAIEVRDIVGEVIVVLKNELCQFVAVACLLSQNRTWEFQSCHATSGRGPNNVDGHVLVEHCGFFRRVEFRDYSAEGIDGALRGENNATVSLGRVVGGYLTSRSLAAARKGESFG